jgi:hypothetical protein
MENPVAQPDQGSTGQDDVPTRVSVDRQMLTDEVQMKNVVQIFSRLRANRAPNLAASVPP